MFLMCDHCVCNIVSGLDEHILKSFEVITICCRSPKYEIGLFPISALFSGSFPVCDIYNVRVLEAPHCMWVPYISYLLPNLLSNPAKIFRACQGSNEVRTSLKWAGSDKIWTLLRAQKCKHLRKGAIFTWFAVLLTELVWTLWTDKLNFYLRR